MQLALRTDGVEIRAPAKVNFFLEVLAKRPDGYHAINTLMVAVSLTDTLEFKEDVSGNIQLLCNHSSLTTGRDNLVCRAAELLRQETGSSRGATIRLTKRIPLAAGLAGGSSNAAAALVGLNELWRLRLDRMELGRLAAQLGSDVAFFILASAAWCTGRGEIVTPLALQRPLDLVMVCPSIELATARVYGGVEVPSQPVNGDAIHQAMTAGDVEAIGQLLHNRLQPAAERLCPRIADWRQRLADWQPAGVAMSGSGSSVFALCRNRREALRIARLVRDETHGATPVGTKIFLVRSCV